MRRKKSRFLVVVSDLKAGENFLEWEFPGAELAIEDILFTREIKVKMLIKREGNRLLIFGSVSFSGRLTCAYCGESFEKDFFEEFTSCYLRGGEKFASATEHESEATDSEIDTVSYAGDFVDFQELIRDNVILSIPIAPKCERHGTSSLSN